MDRATSHAARHRAALEALFEGLPGPLADFGCGEGIFAGRPGYVGLDAAPEAASNVRADVRRVPLRAGSCAGVLCVNTLHLVPEPLRVLEEIDRVLRPGGRAYVKNRWYKTAGRRNAPRSLLARLAHQASFWLHGLLHGGRPLHIRRNPDGTSAVCPGCFRRWFAARGYRVDRAAAHVMVLEKSPAR